jgi:tRNA nucleotidyltransferase (CCA-adding enzyme)
MNRRVNVFPDPVTDVMETLERHGYQAYLVGGSVRDIFLGRGPNDWDIATDATPDEVKSIFPKVIPTGEKYGTVTVYNGLAIEVTTFRKDGCYSNGRRPESVEFSKSLKEDVERRDFTINAMAMTKDGEVVDPLNCQRDLRTGIIETVGNPDERFREDALRMMRAVRFASQLGFQIGTPTWRAISENNRLLANVSQERIRDELVKILMSWRPHIGIQHLIDTGLIEMIIPEMVQCVGFDQLSRYHYRDVAGHIIETVRNCPLRLNVRLAALLHDIAKPKCFTVDEEGEGRYYRHHLEGEIMAKEILVRLKFDNQTVSNVCILVREHMSRYDFLKPTIVKRFINRVGVDNLEDLFALQIADITASYPPYDFSQVLTLKRECYRILDEKEPLTVRDLAVNGHDLMNWGMSPGKEMGQMLQLMLNRVLENPEINTKEGLKEVYEREQVFRSPNE